ncbi:MAG: DUF460 domain-containing protein [Candidatus Aramenus sp.]|nr:DUF460 domain-containing protein [Candidatus Aramenus sp.]
MRKFLGIDIEPRNSPLSASQPRYSIVVIDEGGNVIQKMENVPLSRVIRIAWEQEISVIATDNVYELGSSDREVVKVLSLFPETVEVVQVTYLNGEFKDIREVAKLYGIEVQGKPNPLRTAYLAALLASKGAGTKIKLIENKTKIIISKGRRSGPGGMSSNRYKRHLRGLVLRVFKQVKEALDKNGFDYDVIVKKTKSGMEGAVFVVYASRESLYGIVKKMKGHDINLEIKPVYKTKIEFADKKESSKPLIIGIDPGIEVGVAAIDFYGKPVLLESRRGIDRDDIISLVREKGVPVILSTDVNPLPDTVKRLAGALNSKIYVPEKSLSVDEKQEMLNQYCERFGLKITNPHIRDALAAALKAYNEVEKKIRQSESLIRRFDIDIDENVVFRCIISGSTLAECIEREIEKKLEGKEQPKLVITPTAQQKSLKNANDELTFLKHENNRLRALLKSIFKEKEELEKKIEEIRLQYNAEVQKDRKIYELSNIIEQKNKAILQLQEENLRMKEKIERYNAVIYDLLRGKLAVVSKDSPLLYVKNGKLFALGEEVNEELALYVDADLAVVDPRLLQDLKALQREKELNHDVKVDDVKRLIEKYRLSRLKEHNFSL